ncbi:MAG: hypothetical protein LQ340_005847, partial [Diploschistes diacapsis]
MGPSTGALASIEGQDGAEVPNGDDTSVAVLEKHGHPPPSPRAALHFHEKITANNAPYQGIHPLNSAESHQAHLPGLVQRALHALPRADHSDPLTTFALPCPTGDGSVTHHLKPTFISATRGPGMRSSLATGLDTAKGLALALSVPLVGVHHMQAHLLTPRLCNALATPSSTGFPGASGTPSTNPPPSTSDQEHPSFPLLTLLISGGHTLLLHSTSLTSHIQLASTADIAAGDCIDKIARL